MAKRFTDTEKWKDEWYLSLSNDNRIIWQYLLDNCSIAGIMKKNFKLLNFCCNVNVGEKELLEIFDGRLIDCGDFYFIPKFLIFQYPNGLDSNKPAVISVKNELKIKGLLKNYYRMINKPLHNDYQIIKDKDKDIDKDKDTDKDIKAEFENFWNLYDKKRGDKEKILVKWLKLSDEDKKAIFEYIPKYKQSQPDKQYRKDPSTFLNNKSWNDELIYSEKTSAPSPPRKQKLNLTAEIHKFMQTSEIKQSDTEFDIYSRNKDSPVIKQLVKEYTEFNVTSEIMRFLEKLKK